MGWWAKAKASTGLMLLVVVGPFVVVAALVAANEAGVLDRWIEFLESVGG